MPVMFGSGSPVGGEPGLGARASCQASCPLRAEGPPLLSIRNRKADGRWRVRSGRDARAPRPCTESCNWWLPDDGRFCYTKCSDSERKELASQRYLKFCGTPGSAGILPAAGRRPATSLDSQSKSGRTLARP